MKTTLHNHTFMLAGFAVGSVFFQLIASAAAMGEIGMWVAFVAVVLSLFFPHQFPDWLELPGAIILIIVGAPESMAGTIRGSSLGAAACLVIACYLLQEHIRASGGFKNSFTKANGLSNAVDILLLLAYPVWYFVLSF